MNTELFNKFWELNLPIGQYAIFGSGPMAVRGLRESNDIDFIVTEAIFEEYSQKPDWEKKISRFGDEFLAKGDFEMVKKWAPGEWDIEKLIKEAEIIDGLAFVRLEDVIKWKKIYNREKDWKDIELIENYLKQKKLTAWKISHRIKA